MTGTYQIKLDNIGVGTAVVAQHGLYYHIVCDCLFAERGLYSVSVQSGEHSEYLGICVPEGDVYRLEKNVPIKRFPEKKLFFFASRSENNKHTFIPIQTGDEFQYLSELMNTKFYHSDNRCGVIFH